MARPNFYSSNDLDRMDAQRRDPAWVADQLAQAGTRLVPVWRHRNFVARQEAPRAIFLETAGSQDLLSRAQDVVVLGLRERIAYVAIDLSSLEAPEAEPLLASRGEFLDLRAVGPLLDHWEGSILAYARGILYWHARHRHCGVCGAATESVDAGHARRCRAAECRTTHFPRTDPAVIMLVHDGERCVLGRQANWPPGMHSTLAGFVELGESLEDAVVREVAEEVGIEVADVRYHSSQPWPFPSSLMLGFHARYASGRLRVNPDELEGAGWFTRQQLLASPEDESFRLPRADSIARRLIETWLKGPA